MGRHRGRLTHNDSRRCMMRHADSQLLSWSAFESGKLLQFDSSAWLVSAFEIADECKRKQIFFMIFFPSDIKAAPVRASYHDDQRKALSLTAGSDWYSIGTLLSHSSAAVFGFLFLEQFLSHRARGFHCWAQVKAFFSLGCLASYSTSFLVSTINWFTRSSGIFFINWRLRPLHRACACCNLSSETENVNTSRRGFLRRGQGMRTLPRVKLCDEINRISTRKIHAHNRDR